MSSYVSIPPHYPCHLLTNLICHYICLFRISTLATFLLYQSSYVSIPHTYPCHLLTNLICHYGYPTSLTLTLSYQLDLSTLVTFLSTRSVNLICMCLSHIIPLSPSYKFDLSSILVRELRSQKCPERGQKV